MTIEHVITSGVAGLPRAPQAKGAGVLVAVYNDGDGEGDEIIATSSDNETWTVRLNISSTFGPNASGVGKVLWTGSAFFLVVSGGEELPQYDVLRSLDGITWTVMSTGALATDPVGVGNGYLYVWRAGQTYRTADGITFSLISYSYTSASTSEWITHAAYSPAEGLYVAFVSDGENGMFIHTSSDGLAFSELRYEPYAYRDLLYFPARGEFFVRTDFWSYAVTTDMVEMTQVQVLGGLSLHCYDSALDVGDHLLIYNTDTECLPFVCALRADGTEFEPVARVFYDEWDYLQIEYDYSWDSIGPAIQDNAFLYGRNNVLGLVTLSGGGGGGNWFWTNFIGQREEE